MNCKPGDLAVVVRARMDPSKIGKIVEVICWHSRAKGWVVEPPLCVGGWEFPAVHDDCLQPIRNPGDDAIDETLAWLPVPSKDIQHAMEDLRAHIAQGTREKAGAA